LLEANAKSPSCCFRSETLAPGLKGESPANFDTRGEWKLGRRDVQADKSDEFVCIPQFDRPEAPSPLGDKGLATVGHCIACRTIEWGGEEFHDLRVCVERGEGLAVGRTPLAQKQAICVELDYLGHFLCGSFMMGNN
jgi:hypothetical protein